MSTNAKVKAFVDAQFALAQTVQNVQVDFGKSAMLCSDALKEKGETLLSLAEANKARLGGVAGIKIVSPYVYTSPASITYHALTGDLLSLPFDDDAEDDDHPVVPTEVQVDLIKALSKSKGLGTKRVKEIIRRSRSQQAAIAKIAAEMDAVKAAASEESAGSGEESGEESAPVGEEQNVDTLLARALAMLDGVEISDTTRALVAELSAKVAPLVAVAAA